MSNTALLHSLFEQHVKLNNESNSHCTDNIIINVYAEQMRRLQHIKHSTISKAMNTIEETVRESLRECATHIQETLNAIDLCVTNTTFIEQELLLSEGQLLTALTTLKEFHEQVKCAMTSILESCTKQKRIKLLSGNTINADKNDKHENKLMQISSWVSQWITGHSHSECHSSYNNNNNNNNNIADKTTAANNVSLNETYSVANNFSEPSVDYYRHLDAILTVLEVAVASWRLQLVLCKEELALYKNELILFGHAGVLTCSEADVLTLQKVINNQMCELNNNSNNKSNSVNNSCTPLHNLHNTMPDKQNNYCGAQERNSQSMERTQDELTPHFGLVTNVSHHAKWLLNDIVTRATGKDNSATHLRKDTKMKRDALAMHYNTITTTTTNIIDNTTSATNIITKSQNDQINQKEYLQQKAEEQSTSFSNERKNDNDSEATSHHDANSNETHSNRNSPLYYTQYLFNNVDSTNGNIMPITYSPEEEHVLQQQMTALHEEQEQASAKDAKQIESAVRELSQLTSLMNEQVMLQSEQFNVVLKNTEEAHVTMSKAVREVDKASQHFWNSTRQLIALL